MHCECFEHDRRLVECIVCIGRRAGVVRKRRKEDGGWPEGSDMAQCYRLGNILGFGWDRQDRSDGVRRYFTEQGYQGLALRIEEDRGSRDWLAFADGRGSAVTYTRGLTPDEALRRLRDWKLPEQLEWMAATLRAMAEVEVPELDPPEVRADVEGVE